MSAVSEPGALRATRFLVGASWRNGPGAFVLSLFETVGRVLEALVPLLVGLLVTGALQHDVALVWWGGAGIVVSQGLQFVLMTVGVHARLDMTDRIGHDFEERVGRLSGSVATTDHLDDPAHQDRMQSFTERSGALGGAFNALVNTFNNAASPITTFVVAWLADPRLLLLLIVAIPSTWAVKFTTRWDEQAEHASAPAGRLSGHLMGAMVEPTPASELRVMGARAKIATRASEAVRAWRRPSVVAARHTSVLTSAISTIYLLSATAILVWMTRDALHGAVTVGALTTAVLVIGDFRDSVESISWTFTMTSRMVRAGRRYLWLSDYVAEVDAIHAGTLSPPQRLTEGIRLRDVTFTYPGAKTPTFLGLSLDLPAGSTVAIVGENGAGKSTLVKLLTGIHDLDEGEITIDGVDLRDLSLPRWRASSSGAFQDHMRFEVSARDAIGLGDLEQEPTDDVVRGALTRASATDVLRALPDGLDTQLGTDWPGGVGLSGGQWQRLAIARGMMRERPLLLVLDEPTSALDPATEHRLFDGYAEAARRTRDNGGITLLVTHRFSTVSAADLVVVLDQGQVAEVGTHADLIARGGHYAQLYELQAAGYR
ncbi:ABC transporter ATP-binding protein [Calidifontibacter sp. DB0510]|uniref:ABC transporter ATP-binding protein n=1 Tax=Metallococcus carri TaxID=1656884 RepID=A0A967AY95_9MICO|nr:ABC transporter ATP-binding protein [Metallococcus carri]NHN54639.1 ABC transporter ATP-binding protein [Metallococcus carri]NOP36522.1 ABC transporter ATP-binding protein [Calidifontibacter sp. DB2511S]